MPRVVEQRTSKKHMAFKRRVHLPLAFVTCLLLVAVLEYMVPRPSTLNP